MDQNPYQAPRESGERQQGGNVFRRGGVVVALLWIFAGMAAFALLDLLFMYIGIWRGTR